MQRAATGRGGGAFISGNERGKSRLWFEEAQKLASVCLCDVSLCTACTVLVKQVNRKNKEIGQFFVLRQFVHSLHCTSRDGERQGTIG